MFKFTVGGFNFLGEVVLFILVQKSKLNTNKIVIQYIIEI